MFWATHIALAIIITAVIVLLARQIYSRLISRDSKEAIGRDCEQAILKKQRLERGVITTQ